MATELTPPSDSQSRASRAISEMYGEFPCSRTSRSPVTLCERYRHPHQVVSKSVPCVSNVITRYLTLGLMILAVLVIAGQRLLDPATWTLAQAVRDLGPISGWRCAHRGAYVYDPRRDRTDSTLLSEAPEDIVRVAVPEVTVERVEADLKSGETVVWSRIGAEKDGGPRRVYVLSPGRLQAIADGSAAICYAHLGDWRIVAEHTLG